MGSTPYFTGRQDKLSEIHHLLGDFSNPNPKEIALWGMPGVGKSQTSLQYLRRHNGDPNSKYKQVLFFRANDRATLQHEFRKTAMGLRLVKDSFLEDGDRNLFAQAVLRWLHRKDDWLLIFDNVSDLNDLQGFRPSSGRGNIIYTTRSQTTAELLCPPPNTVEIKPMSIHNGSALVKTLMGTPFSQVPNADAVSREVVSFARGLPLAIEQLTHLAKSQSMSLENALQMSKRKFDFLKQQGKNMFHENNFSTGAILASTFEAMAKKYPMAGTLFQILSYMEPSLITVSMLLEGASEMESHLTRLQTYTRGAIRTPEGQEEYNRQTTYQKFDLLNYDPFATEWCKRILHIGQHRKSGEPSGLPQIDSQSDIEMQDYWQSNPKFRGVFSDKHQMTCTLNQLEASGLVRRVNNDALWIHDLFAELMTAYTADSESSKLSGAKLHVATTLVWLAFPVPERRQKVEERCGELLPHAQSCLRHLREHGSLLTDATVGAELSHSVASTICMRKGTGLDGTSFTVDEEWQQRQWREALAYYKDAFSGYMAAQKRMMAHPGVRGDMSKVGSTIRCELAAEVACERLGKSWRYYSTSRWTQYFERFGGNAVWRCLQTCARIGVVLIDLRKLDEAEWWLRKVKSGMESIWGPRLDAAEVEAASSSLLGLLMGKKDWEAALVIAEERRAWFAEYCGYKGPAGLDDPMSFVGPECVAKKLGVCLINLGRWDEGINWLQTALVEIRTVYGKQSLQYMGRIKDLVWANQERGNWVACLGWWMEATALLTNEKDPAYSVAEVAPGFKLAKEKWEETWAADEEFRLRVEKTEEVIQSVLESVRLKAEMDEVHKLATEDDLDDAEAMAFIEEALRRGKERGEPAWNE